MPNAITDDGWHRVREAAASARMIFEAGFGRSEVRGPEVAGTCLFASVFLASLVNRFGVASAIVRGGGDGAQGALAPSGVWCGHYWVEVAKRDGAVAVVDITADQFGWPPVRVIPMPDAMQWYRAGPQGEVDDVAEELAKDLGCVDMLLGARCGITAPGGTGRNV